MTDVRFAHALTVDVEDWFQVLNMRDVIAREDWDRHELRCRESTKRLLDLCARHGARATFFCLGWIAERMPEVVRAIRAAGHEIGSHGYDHRVLQELGPDGFADDLARTEKILLDITGERPTSFRACTWSITQTTSWALPILVRRGYTIDSSIFPVRHPDYGVPGAPAGAYRIACEGGELTELPPLTLGVLGRRLAVGGGGYLRLFPTFLLERGLAAQQRLGMPGCVYVHPWELDPDQPRQPLSGLRGFRHYVNLARTSAKLARVLARHRFVGVAEALAQVRALPTIAVTSLLGPAGS